MIKRCTGRRPPRRAPRCAEQRFHRIVAVELGAVSVVVIRPRCLVIAPTVTSYGTA